MKNYDDLGKLILRVTVGGLMLFHGVDKLQSGIGGISGMLAAKGLPTFLAYGVYVGEIVAPLLLVLGLFTRPAALVFVFNMIVAVALAHPGDLFKFGEHGGWALELQGFYIFTALVVALIGPGAWSLDAKRQKKVWWRFWSKS